MADFVSQSIIFQAVEGVRGWCWQREVVLTIVLMNRDSNLKNR